MIKGSMFVDHLERIMLSQFEPVVCWMEHCGKKLVCSHCQDYTRAHPPVFPAEAPIEVAGTEPRTLA